MPRQKNEIVVSDDTRAMELAAQNQHEKEMSVQELDLKYLPDGESYNLFVCMSRAKDAENTAGQAFIALGQQLALIKAHETSEQFHAAMESLDVSWRTANYAMAAARKFSNSPLGANFGRTTLKVLSVLDDEQIAQMEETGELPGVGTIDEIKQMKRKDLEDSLRKEKEDRQKEREALEKVVRQKESKISDMEMELAGRQPPTKEDLAQAKLDELKKDLFRQVGGTIHELQQLIALVERAQQIDGVTVEQLDAWALIEEPEDFFPQVFELAEELNEMIENIRPAKPESEDEE